MQDVYAKKLIGKPSVWNEPNTAQ